MSTAVEEAQGIEKYDYLIINDELTRCVEEVHGILRNEHYRVFRNIENIEDMRAQLSEFAKK